MPDSKRELLTLGSTGVATVVNGQVFPVQIGHCKSAIKVSEIFRAFGLKLTPRAANMMLQKGFVFAVKEKMLEVIILSVSDLGFKGGAMYQDVCIRTSKLGLHLCPPEVGPALFLAHKNQLMTKVYVAMTPMRFYERGFAHGIFMVGLGNEGSCLDVDEIYSDDFYESHRLFAVVRFKEPLHR
jgi:hypothetical protein